jgi:hypothetical protein
VPQSVIAQLRALPPELRNAGIAAVALAVSLVFPWYQKSYVPQGAKEFVQDNLSAFNVFSFVEAAVLLLAAGVVFLVWARANRKGFHLPGGDGTVILGAGIWALLLLVWRLFDKPGASGASVTVGIQWGIFAAMIAAGVLAAAGARVRAVDRPEPPNPAADDAWEDPPRRDRREAAPDRRPRDATAVTEVLRERPRWQGDPPAAPERARPAGTEDPADAETVQQPREPPHDRLF